MSKDWKFGVVLFFTLLLSSSVYAQLPLQFIENKGQINAKANFEADLFGGKLLLEDKGFTYLFLHGDDNRKWQDLVHHRKPFPEEFRMRFHTLKTVFVGAKKPSFSGDNPYPFYYNYIIGNDSKHWAPHVGIFHGVTYKGLYPGIDLKVYSDENGMKLDWIIEPFANPNLIKVSYQGAKDLFLNEGKLYVHTSINYMVEDAPVAYQLIDNKRVPVICRYVLNGKQLEFELGAYDESKPLVIDPPIMIFATYSGSSADNFGFTATYDSRGCLYAAGNVTSPYSIAPNGRYPSTPGAYQENPAGFLGNSGPYGGFRCDMAISKYDSAGSNLLWATYLGGTDNDYPHSLVVDNQDRLVLLGSTYSKNFPVDTLGFDTSQGGRSDIVVVKFSFDGSSLLGSTYLGGAGDDGILDGSPLTFNFADNFRGDVQVARNGNVLIASCTKSDNGIPVNSNSLQSNRGGGYDGLLVEFDSMLNNVIWASYWGGDQDDALYSLRLDKDQNLISGGGTMSTTIATSANAVYPNAMGGIDGMVLKVDNSAKTLIASTYVGTGVYDQVYFVDFDLKNHVYVFGQTSGIMPRTPGAYSFPGGGQFLMKFDSNLDTILMATTLGSRTNNPNLSPTAFLVDNCYNIYFAGWGSDAGDMPHIGSTSGLPTTPDALYPSTDGNDFYLCVLDKNAQNLLYATYFGGTQTSDHVDGGTSRFDKRGVVYHSVCGSCPDGFAQFISDIPTTIGSAFPTNLSPRCSNASFKLDFQISYAVEADFTATPLISCAPLTVNLTNRSAGGTDFLWTFGDGTSDTSYNTQHIYSKEGKYRIWLKILDSVSCNLSDSAFIDVEVIPSTNADFDFSRVPCSNEVVFKPTGGSAALGYEWDFGDGTTSKLEKPQHRFSNPGIYTVRLITNPGGTCADTLDKSVDISEPIKGKVDIPNVFTPGNDNQNPCYRFDGLLDCDELEISIYNRYAELVFESKDPNFCWDGREQNNGNLLVAGVYYVLATIQINGEPPISYKGTVTMIR